MLEIVPDRVTGSTDPKYQENMIPEAWARNQEGNRDNTTLKADSEATDQDVKNMQTLAVDEKRQHWRQ